MRASITDEPVPRWRDPQGGSAMEISASFDESHEATSSLTQIRAPDSYDRFFASAGKPRGPTAHQAVSRDVSAARGTEIVIRRTGYARRKIIS